jgi:hypothetical protein
MQLFVLGALNILTDIMLIVLPMPTLSKVKLSLVRYMHFVKHYMYSFLGIC